jgi:hypothetical protein
MRTVLSAVLMLLAAPVAAQLAAAPPAAAAAVPVTPVTTVAPPAAASAVASTTFSKEYINTVATQAFGPGAAGMNELIDKVFGEMGEPDGYILGREAGGAFVFGVRYGSGVLNHKIEGQQDVFWTGPSAGFDFGADGSKALILVYHLHDTADLFHRFAAASGKLYAAGGLSAQYLRNNDVVLIPVTLGIGMRLGVNAGWLSFSREQKYLPF